MEYIAIGIEEGRLPYELMVKKFPSIKEALDKKLIADGFGSKIVKQSVPMTALDIVESNISLVASSNS